MLQCDDRKCNAWAHHSCIGVTEEIAREMEWFCDSCATKRQKDKQRHCSMCDNLVMDPLSSIYCVKCDSAVHTKCFGDPLKPGETYTCGSCVSKARKSELALLKDFPSNGVTQRSSSNKSVASFKSVVNAAEVNALKQAKIDNLREQRRLMKSEAELIKQENDLIDQQLENMTIVSSEVNDDRQGDFDENPMLSRFMDEQRNNVHNNQAPTNEFRGVEHTVQRERSRGPQQTQLLSANHGTTVVQRDGTVNLNQWTARQSIGRELPHFTGRPEEWPSFIAAYENSTAVCGFTDQENLVRLQKAIKHPARAHVESLMYSPACVSRILATLKRMFAQPTQLFNSYLDKFKREPPPREDKPESVMVYAASVQNLCAVIQSTHLESHMSNPFVMEVLIEKLPQSFRYQWDIYLTGKKNDMTTFIEWLDELSDRVCRVNPNMNLANYAMRSRKPLEETPRKGVKKDAHVHHHDTADSPKITQTSKCAACDGKCKSLAECQKFVKMQQQERWELICSKRICKQCLKKHNLRPPYHCSSRIKCEEPGCNGFHNRLMHRFRIEPKNNEDEPKKETVVNHHASNAQVLFRFIPVKIRFGSKMIEVGAFLDEGSSGTFIDDEVAKQLGAFGPSSPLCIQYTSNNSHCETESMRISLSISGSCDSSREYHLEGVQTVKDLSLATQSLDYQSLSAKYQHLKDLPVLSYQKLKPRLLIGLNNWSLGIPIDVKLGSSGDPIAAQCRLGWTIFASQREGGSQSVHYCCYADQSQSNNEHLDEMMRKYYSLDSLGVKQPENNVTSNEDRRALRLMNDTIQHHDDRYEMGLLWKHDEIQLPNSREMALRRMYCLEARLRRDVNLVKAVEAQVTNMIEKGYARKMNSTELDQECPRRWYLPVFPVVNPNKPGKVRMVFDAAAKVADVSLNSALLKGPDQNSSLIGVLMRFRQRRVGIAGDIREMFMQVKIRKPDCYSQLFLYRQNEDMEPETYILESMTFGATCSPTCAQFVKNYNAEVYGR